MVPKQQVLAATVAALALSSAQAAADPATPGTGFFLTEAAKTKGAVCLDGTPGAYYLSPGSGSGTNSWYIHMQGGGWCRSLEDCAGRSTTDLGTSKAYTANKTAAEMQSQSGAMVRDPASNPQMHNWNHVWIKYCDGNSFTGNNATTSDAPADGKKPATTLYYRGSLILDATIESLLANPLRPLAAATEVVVGGGSAGGLATFIHCDRWAAHFEPSKTHYACMADSGFFLDYESGPQPPRFPEYGYHTGMVWAYEHMNSSAGVQKECQAHYGALGEGWRCNFAQYTASFNKAPLFARQSTYDSWQSGNVLHSSDAGAINEFGANLTRLIEGSLLTQKQHAVFLDSCHHHCGEWDMICIDDEIVHDAFAGWYNGSSSKSKWIQGKTYPCTSCCKDRMCLGKPN